MVAFEFDDCDPKNWRKKNFKFFFFQPKFTMVFGIILQNWTTVNDKTLCFKGLLLEDISEFLDENL